jgi:hypothetical protein
MNTLLNSFSELAAGWTTWNSRLIKGENSSLEVKVAADIHV